MSLKLNVWYTVIEKFTDPLGYCIKEGWRIKPTSIPSTGGLYRQTYQRVSYELLSSDGTYNRFMGIQPRSSDELLPFLEQVEDEGPILAQIKETRKDSPESHVNLDADMLIGSDPEVFVVDKRGSLVPAFDFLKSEKDKGSHEDDWGVLCSDPYWDGFQAEFQLNSVTCHVSLTNNIRAQLKYLYDLAQAHSEGAQLVASPTIMVPKGLMDKATDKQAAFGCSPSLNAYGKKGESIRDGRDLAIRFAGFHIHHGTKSYNVVDAKLDKNPIRLVKSMDNIGGVLSVSLLEGLEEPIRRQYYGLAGEYRTPKHGLEYRVISSAALWHPALTYIHLDFVRAGCQLAIAGLSDLWEGSEDETQAIINSLDVDGARAALKRNRRLMCGLLGRYYGRLNTEYTFDGLIMKGIKQYIPLDMTKNWGLTAKNFSPQFMASLSQQLFGNVKTIKVGG